MQILSTLKIPLQSIGDTDLTQRSQGVIDPEYNQYANECTPRSGVDLCKLLDVNTDSHTL